MRNRVERLRLWLLAGAGLLLVVLAVFIGSARYLMHHFLAKLPAKLGVNIESDGTGVTLSRYDDRTHKTVFIIHAGKKTKFTNGKIALHDVNMTLYGRKGDRADRIYGDDFEYDESAGLVRAIGLVHIDLQAAGTAAGVKTDGPDKAKGGARETGASDAKILHATTSGLVYMDKLGVAATSEAVEFQLGEMTGHAVGADYNSDSGVLLLHSAVTMSGTAGKRPVALTASAAELDTRDQRAVLRDAKYSSLGRTVTADQATLHRRQDGSLERIEAQGNATLEGPTGRVVSQRANVSLNERSEPKLAVLTGGVQYSLDRPLQQRRGQADAATIAFDGQGRASHAVFTGVVHITEKTRATEAAKEPWSVHDLTAAKVDAALAPVDAHQSQLRDVDATGSARLVLVNNGSLASAKGEGTTELAADDLKAHLVGSGNAKLPPQLDTVAGRGRTSLHQLNAEGLEQTSTGDSLDAKFRPGVGARLGGAASGAEGRQASDLLSNSVQAGHVTIHRRVPPKAGAKPNTPDDVQDAVAEKAAYDGDLDRMMLTGGVQLRDAESMLWADQVGLDHKTGNAQAEGSVKVNYLRDVAQAGAKQGSAEPEPTHILADRAELNHATKVATFYGRPVRMWQGASQVQAPVIELARMEKRVTARGGSGGAQAGVVHTVLVKTASDKPAAPKAAVEKPAKAGLLSARGVGKAGAGPPSVVRIASGGLVYSGVTNQADFTGGVRLESVDWTMVAREAVAYLSSANADAKGKEDSAGSAGPAKSGTDIALDGRLDHVVATGHVEVDQPGLHATGERLIYTASDELSVLTGDKDVLPKAVDTVKGTSVTGAALLFHSRDDSVEALSAAPGEKDSGQRVRADAEVNEDKKSGSGEKTGKAKH